MPNWLNTEMIRQLSAIFIKLPANFGVRVYRSTDQAIGTGAWDEIEFSHERWDTGVTNDYPNGFWDSAVNTRRLYATKAGFYQISGTVRWDASAAGSARYIAIYHSGAAARIAQHNELTPTAGDNADLSVSTSYWMNVGEYVELHVYQNSGGNLDIISQANFSPEFAMVRIP